MMAIGMAVVVANLPALTGAVDTNPLILTSGLVSTFTQWLPGLSTIDPSAGFSTQSLGHLVAMDWLHGHIPWWNPYEGVGAPLAGGMQSGPFFPLTLLLVVHQGMLAVQVALELVAGWATYFLIRRLAVGRTFAVAAGVAFALCGTFAWFNDATDRPVAFLPLCLLGVERAIAAGRDGKKGGWQLLALALALSILAGFPETAAIDGVLVAWWAVFRIAGPARSRWRPIVAKLVGGAVVGAALCAPLLVAFAGYLPDAYLGGHSGGFASVSLAPLGLAQTVLPYGLGPIFAFHSTTGGMDSISLLWDNVGGYLSVTVIAAGLVGLVGRRGRSLRVGLGAWIVLCLLRTFGFPPVVHVLAHVPIIRLTAFYRYANPTWELAAIVLAALGLDDIARGLTRRRLLVVGVALTGLLAVWAAVTAWPLLTSATGPAGSSARSPHLYAAGSLAGAVLMLALLTGGGMVAGRHRLAGADDDPIDVADPRSDPPRTGGPPPGERTRRWGRLVMGGAICLESVALLGFTYLSAPTAAVVDSGSAAWLQAHLGTSRFYTLGPIQPEFGSYYGIAQANVNELPLSKAWVEFVATHLDPNSPKVLFTGGSRINFAGPTAAQELTKHLSDFESVGVRFVVESPTGRDSQGQPFPAAGTAAWPVGPRLVYRDPVAEIWELPGAAPMFSLRSGGGSRSGGCTVVAMGSTQATVRCRHPATLDRQVLAVPGWSAEVEGRQVAVGQDRGSPGGLFQAVRLPAGSVTVRFTYLPAHEYPATLVMVVAGAVAVGSLVIERRRRWAARAKDRGHDNRDGSGPVGPLPSPSRLSEDR
jgi:hypothetical protein